VTANSARSVRTCLLSLLLLELAAVEAFFEVIADELTRRDM